LQDHWNELGNPTNTAEAAAKGRQISIREADRFAQTVLPSSHPFGTLAVSGVTSDRNERRPHNGPHRSRTAYEC
ncbi:MAG: hypothetical protein E5X64_38230, partial [Mesorhizobium sp.]